MAAQQYFLLVETDQTELVAVGPFSRDDAAREWEDRHGDAIGTVRGCIRRVAPSTFLRVEGTP